MLTELEFMDKKRILLDKPQATFVMNRNPDGTWDVISLPKGNYMLVNMHYTVYKEEEAYEYYKERMESYGFRQFPILME